MTDEELDAAMEKADALEDRLQDDLKLATELRDAMERSDVARHADLVVQRLEDAILRLSALRSGEV